MNPTSLHGSGEGTGVALYAADSASSEGMRGNFLPVLNRSLFLLSFSINAAAAMALFLHLNLQTLYLDSVSRSLHAYYVLWGFGAPHLAAIGFIWLPLPVMVQLPLVLWQPLALTGLAGGLQSGLAMAISTVMLEAILTDLGIARQLRVALLVAFQINPMMWLYAANGMTESMQICTMLTSCLFFLRWARRGQISDLVFLGVAGAAAIMTRYEGIAIVMATTIAMAAVCLREGRSVVRIEGEFLAYLVWPAYAFFLWFFFNWLIQGDPLYFFRGPYSAMAQGYFSPEDLRPLIHNPWLTTLFVGERVLAMAPLYLPLALLLFVVAIVRLDTVSFGLLLFPAATLAFGWLTHFQGGQFGWFRFFIYAVPGLILCVALVPRSRLIPARFWPFAASMLMLGVFVGTLITGLAMLDPRIGKEESVASQAIRNWEPLDPTSTEEYRVADYLRNNVAGKRQVLMDDFVGFNILRLSGGPDMFVLTVDTDFGETLKNPRGKVEWILVPKPEGVGRLDAVNNMYPSLYNGGLGFVELEKEWDQWRLYRLIPQT